MKSALDIVEDTMRGEINNSFTSNMRAEADLCMGMSRQVGVIDGYVEENIIYKLRKDVLVDLDERGNKNQTWVARGMQLKPNRKEAPEAPYLGGGMMQRSEFKDPKS